MKKTLNLFATLFFLSLISAPMAFAGDEVSPMTVDGAKTVTTEEAKKSKKLKIAI